MRIQLLDNITGKWAIQWIVIWFICGVLSLSTGFWLTTEHTMLDWFYLGVSFIGLVCVVSLSFRKTSLPTSMVFFIGQSILMLMVIWCPNLRANGFGY